MSSEAITQNDLREILTRVTGATPSEYKKLLWTNPNPSAYFSSQTLSIDLTNYDDIEVTICDFSADATRVNRVTTELCPKGKTTFIVTPYWTTTLSNFSGRAFTPSNTGIVIDEGRNQSGVNNGNAVPLVIYGIKYERVQPPVIDAEVEALDAKATLFRIGRIRVLKLDKFKISNVLTIPSADRPQSTQSGTATRIWSDNETYGAVALLYVNADGTVVASYWGTYNNSSGASVATGDDRITGTVFWYVTE